MITFNEFLEHKRIESTVTECAHMMVELDVDPYRYIYENLKDIDPVLAEGWWDNVKSTAGNIWKGVKSFAGDVATGARTGYNKAADTIAGPVAKFDAAVRALDDLIKVLGSDKRFERFMSDVGGGTVVQYIEKVKEALMKDKDKVPQLLATQVKQDYGTRGEVEGKGPAQPGQPVTVPGRTVDPQGNPNRVPIHLAS